MFYIMWNNISVENFPKILLENNTLIQNIIIIEQKYIKYLYQIIYQN